MEEHKQTQLLQLYFEINRKIENLNLYYSICGQIKYGELVKYSKPVFSEIWSLLTRLQAEFMLCKSEMSTSVIKEISKKGFLIVSKQVAEWIAQNERELYRIGGKNNKDLITPYQLQILSLDILQMFEQELERREQEQERREQEQERREQEQERREQEQECREQEQECDLPIELQTDKARKLFNLLLAEKWITLDYKPTEKFDKIALRNAFIDIANEYLNLKGDYKDTSKGNKRRRYLMWCDVFKWDKQQIINNHNQGKISQINYKLIRELIDKLK